MDLRTGEAVRCYGLVMEGDTEAQGRAALCSLLHSRSGGKAQVDPGSRLLFLPPWGGGLPSPTSPLRDVGLSHASGSPLRLPGRYLSHTELAPLRAPLIPMEHCTTRFFQTCDLDNDKYIALDEWAGCFGIKERECLSKAAAAHSAARVSVSSARLCPLCLVTSGLLSRPGWASLSGSLLTLLCPPV